MFQTTEKGKPPSLSLSKGKLFPGPKFGSWDGTAQNNSKTLQVET